MALDLLRGRHPAELSRAVPGEPASTGQTGAAPNVAAGLAAPAGPAHDGQRQTLIPTGDTAAAGSETTSGIGPAIGRATGSEDADTGRRAAGAVTQAVRAQLTELLDQVRELNRSDENRQLVAGAARRIKDALAPLKIRWCLITADTAGEVIHGHNGYRPPAAMRRLVQTRTNTCVFPTCRRRATACDLDHTVPFHRGGPTCSCNLAPLCRGHHLLKQHSDWTLIQLWPGVLLWITPTGHWHVAGPDP